MQIRSTRTLLAMSAAVALAAAALAPTAAFAKGPGPGDGTCDADCLADQTQQQIRDRDGSGSGSAAKVQVKANAGGGGQVQARAGSGPVQQRASNSSKTAAQTRTNAGNGPAQVRASAKQQSGTPTTATAQERVRGGAGQGAQGNRPEDRPRGPEACDDCQQYETGDLGTEQTEDLVFMAKEEKLAYDVYTYLAGTYDLPIFANIAAAESQHQAAVRAILERYSIPDPTVGMAPGVYDNVDLDQLYKDLVAKGDQGLDEALAVGVFIESDDIDALNAVIARLGDSAPDVLAMYQHLLDGSTRHLAAFDRSA